MSEPFFRVDQEVTHVRSGETKVIARVMECTKNNSHKFRSPMTPVCKYMYEMRGEPSRIITIDGIPKWVGCYCQCGLQKKFKPGKDWESLKGEITDRLKTGDKA